MKLIQKILYDRSSGMSRRDRCGPFWPEMPVAFIPVFWRIIEMTGEIW